MKEKIVITLTRTDDGWIGEVYGKTKKGTTDKITTNKYNYIEDVLVPIRNNIHKIEKWMEQIR